MGRAGSAWTDTGRSWAPVHCKECTVARGKTREYRIARGKGTDGLQAEPRLRPLSFPTPASGPAPGGSWTPSPRKKENSGLPGEKGRGLRRRDLAVTMGTHLPSAVQHGVLCISYVCVCIHTHHMPHSSACIHMCITPLYTRTHTQTTHTYTHIKYISDVCAHTHPSIHTHSHTNPTSIHTYSHNAHITHMCICLHMCTCTSTLTTHMHMHVYTHPYTQHTCPHTQTTHTCVYMPHTHTHSHIYAHTCTLRRSHTYTQAHAGSSAQAPSLGPPCPLGGHTLRPHALATGRTRVPHPTGWAVLSAQARARSADAETSRSVQGSCARHAPPPPHTHKQGSPATPLPADLPATHAADGSQRRAAVAEARVHPEHNRHSLLSAARPRTGASAGEWPPVRGQHSPACSGEPPTPRAPGPRYLTRAAGAR